MPNPLIRKLEIAGALTHDDRAVLSGLCSRTREVAARSDIIVHGQRPNDVHLVLAGVVIRYKIMPGGKRQIVAVLLPGDFCDMHGAILGEMHHSLAALTPCTIVDIPAATIYRLAEDHPRIIRAFWWATLVDVGTLREWIANLGQREAIKRMAHFFCEMRLRMLSAGLADDDGFAFPFTQIDLGDLLGLTSVHVNRSLQSLRDAEFIVLQKRRIQILDIPKLEAFCSFDPAYLHFHRRRVRP